MAGKTYDIITVGGGLGGSALAKAMAEHGARVLVVERERQFKDRVRGEWMAPWGVAEARALGLYELLHDTCGHELPGWDMYLGPMSLGRRDFVTTTPSGVPALGACIIQLCKKSCFRQPRMQARRYAEARQCGV